MKRSTKAEILFKLRSLKAKMNEVEDMLDFSNLQSWAFIFSNWQPGEIKDINGTKNKMILKADERMEFETLIPPGCEFPKHWHDFDEKVEVLSGTYYDKYNGKKYVDGEVVEYKAGDVHTPVNKTNEDLYLLVIFTK